MKDLKYFASYSIPLVAFFGILNQSFWLWATPLFAFGVIPLLEIIFPVDNSNVDETESNSLLKKRIFDWMLYLNVPVVYGILCYAIYTVYSFPLSFSEISGLIVTTGIVLGVNGINVAHELGHRQDTNERFLGKILLLPSFYMHFYIEHNYGHHLNAATPEDPATAKYNQSVYSFWLSSTLRQYFSAWKIQMKLLESNKRHFFSFYNDLLWYTLIQTVYLVLIGLLFNSTVLLFVICSGIVGFLLLETVNYIEHYGLLRFKTQSGRYERVKEIHSWNSNHVVGRIVLYELTRHSDHHYKSMKKYQILDCHEESPQMPFGYPTSMLLSMFPPLWFKIMNKRIPSKMRIKT